MVDTTEAMESQYLTADFVKKSQSQKLVVISGGLYEDTQFGRRLTLKVNIDGKEKEWRPNRDSVKNLNAWGLDSEQWIGKAATLQVITIQGKESIIASPIPEPQPATTEEIKNGLADN